jgi:hypothetical protein
MLELVQDWKPVDNFKLLYHLFLYLPSVLVLVFRIYHVLKFCIVVDLNSTDFDFEKSQVH